MTDQSLNRCPECGGDADNGHDREFPPNPYLCTKCQHEADHIVPAAKMACSEIPSGTDWDIIEENGKKYVKVELDAMVAYREKMEGKQREISGNARDAACVAGFQAWLDSAINKNWSDEIIDKALEAYEAAKSPVREYVAVPDCGYRNGRPYLGGSPETAEEKLYRIEAAKPARESGGDA